MSRTNHHYYNAREIDWNATRMLPGSEFVYIYNKPEREVLGRRNWKRGPRYPEYSCKRWHNPVPQWYKRMVNRINRRRSDRDMRRDGEVGAWRKWGTGRISWFY